MNEVFDKILYKLNTLKRYNNKYDSYYDNSLHNVTEFENDTINRTVDEAKEIVQEVAEEYQKDNKETITKLLSGEWVDCDKVQQALGMSFKECFLLFDFSRTAEWWCLAGETEEERNRNGQKITTKFKLKSNDDGWISCKERLPDDSVEVLVCKQDGILDFDMYEYKYEDWKFNSKNHKNTVIAWRPLPEPYKERENE